MGLVGYERADGKEHDGGHGLAGFTVIWPKNWLEGVAVYGGLWQLWPVFSGEDGWVLVGVG